METEASTYAITVTVREYFITGDIQWFEDRRHWNIENNLHWTLDVVFKEDSLGSKEKKAIHAFILKVEHADWT